MPVVLLPILIKYGIPVATYGIGHLIGWFHGHHSAKKVLTTPANPANPANAPTR
jgi:hypothetical protein